MLILPQHSVIPARNDEHGHFTHWAGISTRQTNKQATRMPSMFPNPLTIGNEELAAKKRSCSAVRRRRQRGPPTAQNPKGGEVQRMYDGVVDEDVDHRGCQIGARHSFSLCNRRRHVSSSRQTFCKLVVSLRRRSGLGQKDARSKGSILRTHGLQRSVWLKNALENVTSSNQCYGKHGKGIDEMEDWGPYHT